MFPLLALCAITFAGCGAAPSGLRFVEPPVVVSQDGSIDVWVRLNRPLKHNTGHPWERDDHYASLEAAHGRHDIPGMVGDAGFPTCYSEDLYTDRKLQDGQALEVSLQLSDTQRVSGLGIVHVWEPGGKMPRAEKLLGCPRQLKGEPTRHRCHGRAGGQMDIAVVSASGTSCAVAQRVMESAGRWTDSQHCFEHLCVSAHRMNRGFRCNVAQSGEAAWDIVCRKGRAEVRGFTAE